MPTTYAIPNGSTAMAATLYAGSGATQAISNGLNNATGVTFAPDLVWIRNRTSVSGGMFLDTIAGTSVFLQTTNANGNASNSGDFVSFNSNGFSVGNGGNLANQTSNNYVGWSWKAGGTAVSNTAGSITSSVSANTTAGFSVVTYTGTGTSGQTVGHGLGVKPAFIIVKRRTGTGGWACWHQSLTGGSEQDRYIYLDLTSASGTTSSYWGSGITSSTFGVWATGGDNNASGATLVAYCFAAVAGYSAFGSVVANASADGPFIYTGFRPRWIMLKRSSAAGAPWSIFDTSRNTYNSTNLELDANSATADSSAGNGMDILSNGFKLRDSAYLNSSSGDTFIYAAFAESPLKFANAR